MLGWAGVEGGSGQCRKREGDAGQWGKGWQGGSKVFQENWGDKTFCESKHVLASQNRGERRAEGKRLARVKGHFPRTPGPTFSVNIYIFSVRGGGGGGNPDERA